MFATIENLREISRRCAAGQPLSEDLSRWLGTSLESFLDHRCRSVDDALGLRFPQGGVPWWREEAIRERDIALRGLAARFHAEYEDAVEGWFPSVVGLVVLATFLALVAGFRCLLVPLKAVVLNLVSVAAAFGAVVLVFQDGHGAAAFGLSGATGGVFPIVSVLVFCTVFGLSMAYEVFLVARVAEAHRRGMDDGAALVEGLARTGRVITSAAAIMIAVFAAFILGDFLLIKMLGFALAVTVLIDATLVRLAIGPALIRLAGRWNWWPGEAARGGEAVRLDRSLAARED